MFEALLSLLRKTFTLRTVIGGAIVAALIWMLIVVGLIVAIRSYGEDDEVADYNEPVADAIVVLGSGLRRDGRAGDALLRRSLWAAQLYQRSLAPAVICTGGVGDGQIRSEAAVCGDILESRGVPENAIFLEEQSRSTEENALYAHNILDGQGWQNVILVTDSFHMLRAQWIFNAEGIDHLRSPVPREQVRDFYYNRHFMREILALHWQAFKTTFNLPFTNIMIPLRLPSVG